MKNPIIFKRGDGVGYVGNIAEIAAELPPAQVIVTSPPYFAKRRYSVPDFWYGGDVNCMHENTQSRHTHSDITLPLTSPPLIKQTSRRSRGNET